MKYIPILFLLIACTPTELDIADDVISLGVPEIEKIIQDKAKEERAAAPNAVPIIKPSVKVAP